MKRPPTPHVSFPSREPIDIPGGASWIYEDRRHITVVCEKHEGGKYIATTQARIPMKFLCRIVDRYRRSRRKS